MQNIQTRKVEIQSVNLDLLLEKQTKSKIIFLNEGHAEFCSKMEQVNGKMVEKQYIVHKVNVKFDTL